MLIPWLYILSYNLETLKVAFPTRDYHNLYYITTTVLAAVNNLMTVVISGVRAKKFPVLNFPEVSKDIILQ